MTPMSPNDTFEVRRDENGNLEAWIVESGGERYLAGLNAEAANESGTDDFCWLVGSAAAFHKKNFFRRDEV